MTDPLESALRLAKVGCWRWQVSTGGLTWSNEARTILGLRPDDAGLSLSDLTGRLHPHDVSVLRADARRALETGAGFARDCRLNLQDGGTRIVHICGEVASDPDGEVTSVGGVIQDVTPLRQAEVTSQRAQDMLESMLRISPEAIVVTDIGGRIILFSAGAEVIFGHKADEVEGMSVEVLMPPRSREIHAQRVAGFAAGDRRSLRMHERGEILGLRKSGEAFPAEASLAKLDTGVGVVFTTIIRDLSEGRAAERRLIEAREEAERASRAKSSFLANMSHEIRTPLNGVLGIAGALARTDLTPKQVEMVHLIEASGRALEGLLSDILDLAKVDAGRMSIRAEAFDLCAMVKDTVALFRASAGEKGVGLVLDLPGAAPCYYRGDDLRLRQVLSNLLSNAVKFTSQGEVRVVVEPVVGAEDASRLRFSVSDTGIGFTAEQSECLFERFEQADGSITRRFGGTGLGLAISKSLVELMGGAITARSQPGAGATFSFEVPLTHVEGPACADAATSVQADRRHQSMQVLLAEDHVINRRAVELILESLPVSLTCVDNGQDAVAFARARRFDLILMDMQMPVMDGLTAIRRIRSHEQAAGLPRTPICVLTANAMPEHRLAAAQAGADSFLSKPIHAEELLTMVAEAGSELDADESMV